MPPLPTDLRGVVAEFDPNELLFRRFKKEQCVDGTLLPTALPFPRPSFNRSQFSVPRDVLHPHCAAGKDLSNWGVFKCAVRDIPREVRAADGVRFHFQPEHEPLPTCYAHSVISFADADSPHGAQIPPSKTAKNLFRIQLAKAIERVIEPDI